MSVGGYAYVAEGRKFSGENIAVTETEAVLLTHVLDRGVNRLGFCLSNGGDDALAAFKVEVQFYAAGPWHDLGISWGSAAGLLKWVSGNPGTLASSANAAAMIETGPIHAIRFKGNCGAGDSTTVNIGGVLS
jgi:hypothetical protein